uniref:Uncharacterized protein n=1 Tax=Tanacetum cinerariifolium TaxID=118510 RepID=A0A699J4R7_TANCI|nr:hypothetical protein [Tanacetum cinerariifolium]
MAKIEKVLSDSDESSSSAKETIVEVDYYTSESENCNESEVDHNDSEEKDHLVDKLIQKFNHKIAKCHKRIEKANQQSKDLENQNKNIQDKYDVLINQVNIFKDKNIEFNKQMKALNKKNADLLAQIEALQDQLKVKHVVIDTHTECQPQYARLEEERYEYMIRYSALCDNNKQHRKKIEEQEILFDKMSRQLVELNNNVLKLQEKILEKETKISELEGCWRERFMNYLEEKTDGEAMINSIQNTAEEKKTRKIDRISISLLIQGLPIDIYSLIDSNDTAKDLCDALERQMRGSEYGEQDRKAKILYEYETFKATE